MQSLGCNPKELEIDHCNQGDFFIDFWLNKIRRRAKDSKIKI
jgi:hypothetical protein